MSLVNLLIHINYSERIHKLSIFFQYKWFRELIWRQQYRFVYGKSDKYRYFNVKGVGFNIEHL